MTDLEGKSIMVTGGTGSFGSALIDYLHDRGATFFVYSRDETKQHEMFVERRDKNIIYIIGDVRDRDKLTHSMRGMDYVFHAAALKHVPTGEKYPEEVISTNVIGTKNVMEAADHCKVKKVVVLSTDKAAYPVGAYGMSKALAEKVVMAYQGDTVGVCLRYGNVLGSRGSIIPLFKGLIKQRRPVTITNWFMTRFILTLDEAVGVAMKCLDDGNNGDLFVMRPPACQVATIVKALEKVYGAFETRVIGIRPGEKMHEVLLTGAEVYRAREEMSGSNTYVRISTEQETDHFFSGVDYDEPEPFTSKNAEQLNADQVLAKLEEAGLV